MNKFSCNNCKKVNCNIKQSAVLVKYDGWNILTDYCSKWEEKEYSEVDRLVEIIKVHESDYSKANYILKNYVSKEKLLEHLTLQNEPYPVGEVFVSRKKVINFIEEQTK